MYVRSGRTIKSLFHRCSDLLLKGPDGHVSIIDTLISFIWDKYQVTSQFYRVNIPIDKTNLDIYCNMDLMEHFVEFDYMIYDGISVRVFDSDNDDYSYCIFKKDDKDTDPIIVKIYYDPNAHYDDFLQM